MSASSRSGVGRVAALIPAAGSGTRLGLGPKAFVPVAGRSLLLRSVQALRPVVDDVLVALPAGMTLPADLAHLGVRAVAGAETRQGSVHALLQAAQADTVLVHDAARPFLPRHVILGLLDSVTVTGAATVALPVADTLVRTGTPGRWGALVDRDGLWAVQTPQAFRRDLLLAAHDQAVRDAAHVTDDATLIVRGGGDVVLVPGDARLFKVTTPGDLHLAQALAAAWDAGEHG